MSDEPLLTARLDLDTSQAKRSIADLARSIPTLKAKVDFTGLGQISRQASEFEKSLGSAQARVTAFGLAAGSVYAVSRAFDELVKSTIEVEKDLTSINVVLGLSINQLSQFSSKLFGIANLTGQSFKVVSQVALDFSRQGLNATETLKRTADAMTLVRIGGTDTETAVKALTATLNTFNEVGLDSTAILNKIATVDTKFSVSGNVIAEALTRVASTAKDAGVSFDRLIGITTALQQITSRGGSVIGNALKSIFQRIQRPEVIDQLNQMGIATEDLNGQMLSADAILTNLAKSYNGLSQAQQQQVTQLSAGLFQANQFKAIIGDLAKQNGIAARATDTASKATDQAARRQAALNETLASQLQTSLNNLTQFGAKVGNISIAPALKNIFSAISSITGDDAKGGEAGEKIGEGVLKGIGNYLSGPGLALIGILAGKLFIQFGKYASQSLSKVLETTSLRYDKEKAITDLLNSEVSIMQKIEALGGGQDAIQQVLLERYEQQNLALNAQYSIVKGIAALTSGLSPNSLIPNAKQFVLSGSEGGTTNIIKNTRQASNFSALSTALSVAVSREKAMGINGADIRIGTSNSLMSPDNPLGLGVYNTKDEPLGIEQGVQRARSNGINPQRSGIVPNFAAPLETIGSPALLPLAEEAFNKLKISVRNGSIAFDKIPEEIGRIVTQFNLTTSSLKTMTQSLRTVVQNLNELAHKNLLPSRQNFGFSQASEPLGPQQTLFYPFSPQKKLGYNQPKLLGSGIPQDVGALPTYLPNPIDPFGPNLTPAQSARLKIDALNKNRLQAKFGQFPNITGGADEIGTTITNQKSQVALDRQKQISAQQKEQAAQERERLSEEQETLAQKQRIANFEAKLSKTNVFSLAGGIFPNSNINQLSKEAKELGQEKSFQDTRSRLGHQAFVSSLIAPLVAGTAQSLIPDTSATSRGLGATVGAVGNIASYAGLGAAVGGPIGAGLGVGAGILLELPKVFESFSSILPDLERHLNDIKDTTVRVNDAFTTYIDTSQKLADISNPENPERGNISQGQLANLQAQQRKSFNSIPPQFKSQIQAAVSKGDFSEAYNLFNIASLNNTQNSDLITDNTNLIKKKGSGLHRFITGGTEDISQTAVDYALGNGPLTRFDKLQNESGRDVLNSILTGATKRDNDRFNNGNFGDSEGSDIQNFLENAGTHNTGVTGITGLLGYGKDVSSGTIAERNKQYVQERLIDPTEDILGITNNKGFTLSQNLKANPSDLSTSDKLEKYLRQHDFNAEKINSATDIYKTFLSQGKAGEYFNARTSPEGINKSFDENQKLSVNTSKTIKAFNDLNQKLENLSNTGAEAANRFRISVVNSLSDSLTKLKSDSIQANLEAKLKEITEGNNEYSKAVTEYVGQISNINEAYSSQVKTAGSTLFDGIGKIIVGQFDQFHESINQKLDSKKITPERGETLFKSQVSSYNNLFKGVATVGDDGKVSFNKDATTQDYTNVKNNLLNQSSVLNQRTNFIGAGQFNDFTSELANTNDKYNLLTVLSQRDGKTPSQIKDDKEKLDSIKALPDNNPLKGELLNLKESGVKESLEKFVDAQEQQDKYTKLLKALNEKLPDWELALTNAINEQASNTQLTRKQFEAVNKTRQKTYENDQINLRYQSGLGRSFSSQSFNLSRTQDIEPNRISAITLQAQRDVLPQQQDVLKNLNDTHNFQFSNISQINNELSKQEALKATQQSSGNYTGALETQGKINDLQAAIAKLGDISSDASQKINQAIESLSPFSSDKANYVKNTNVNRASQGIVNGNDYSNAFFAPLQYNNNDFQKDTVTGLQEFSEELKTDLSSSLLSITKGAQNASQAFRDLGLSLAESLAKKVTDIGIGELFGLGTSALGFGKSKGGFIPGFASGGFVNMGSGTKDDVPAYLSGGEFVINKRAVQRIGKNNLDLINGSPHFANGGVFTQPSAYINNPTSVSNFAGVQSDSLNISGNSANIKLANAELLQQDKSDSTGAYSVTSSSKISPLLSLIGQSSQDNPQNKLKYARERYALNRNLSFSDYTKQLNAYNVSQDISLGQAYLGAAGTIVGGVLNSKTQPASANQITALQAGQGPVSVGTANSFVNSTNSQFDSIANYGVPFQPAATSSFSLPSLSSQSYLSLFSSVGKGGLNVAGAASRANGGSIPTFSGGGRFGGDSSSDKFKAMVMGGEYVAGTKAVNKYGTNFFKSLNDSAPYASGGQVAPSYSSGSNDGTSQIVQALSQIKDKLNGNSQQGNSVQNSGGQTNHVTVNVTMASDGSASNQSSTASSTNQNNGKNSTSQQDSDTYKKLASNFQGLIIKELTNQSRPGGLLSQTFQRTPH